jgi:uncharacterized protein YecE (DUF72 family)
MSELRIGPAGWNYRDWRGIFYPARRPRGFSELGYVAEFFDTVEINSSFYGPFSPQSGAKWVREVEGNARFLFTAKLWQRFTHLTGAGVEEEKVVRLGFDALQNAGKLGAVLLQFPFSFHNTAENLETLRKLTERFREYPLVLEVRHASWDKSEVYEFLSERKVGFCNIDQPIIGRSLKPTAHVTSTVGYVRFHGRRYDSWFSDDAKAPPSDRYDYLYPREELEPWVERIESIAKTSETIFVITNNHPAAKSLQTGFLLATMFLRKKIKVPETMFERYPELIELAAEPPKNPKLF